MRRMLAVLFLISLSACAGSGQVYTSDDDGSTVALEVGDTFVVELAGNPSTGFGWEVVASDDPLCRLVEEPTFEPESDALGAPGTFSFTFEAIRAGTEDLELVYRRSWEDAEPLEAFRMTLEISD